MIKSYLNKIIDEILYTDNNELNFLKWLISYQYNKYPTTMLKRKMFTSLQKCKIICEKDYRMLPNKKCSKFITDYTLNTISRNIQSNTASDYAILLYFYVSTGVFSPADADDTSDSEKFNFFDLIDDLRPLPIPDTPNFDIENYYAFNGKTYLLRKLHLEDRIILFLYIWLADISTISQYNKKIAALTEDCDAISIKNPDRVLENCKKSASRYGYFYSKEPSSTHTKLDRIFVHYLEALPESALAFAPSLITIIFNSLEPNIIKNLDESQYEIFPYDDLIFPLNIHPSDMTDFQLSFWNNSVFLKMMLLPIATSYTKTIQNIAKRFKQKLDKAFEHWKKANALEDNDFEEWEEEQKIDFWLHAMIECDFCFSNSYFDIFCYIYNNQELFTSKKGNRMDATLSLLHLNVFTKWYDALVLMEGMPFSFRNFNFFYLKMLSIFPEYQNIVENAANMPEELLEQAMGNTSFTNMQNLFYEKSNVKLGGDKLLNILKSDKMDESEEIFTSRINPVYKWILLLDDNYKITEDELENFDRSNERFILYHTYRDHVSINRDSRNSEDIKRVV